MNTNLPPHNQKPTDIIFTPKNTASYAKLTSRISQNKQAIVFAALEDFKLPAYIKALGQIIGPNKIIYASKISNNRICIYLDNEESVKSFLEQHNGQIQIQNQTIKARKLIQPSKRLIISNVFPDISNDCLQEALNFLGIKTLSKVTEIKVSIDDNAYKVFSFRRQVYVSEDTKDIPSSIQINIDDETFRVFLTLDGIQCFICKQPGHVSSQCKNQITNQTNSEQLDDPNISLYEENSCDEFSTDEDTFQNVQQTHHPNDIIINTHNDPESINDFPPLPQTSAPNKRPLSISSNSDATSINNPTIPQIALTSKKTSKTTHRNKKKKPEKISETDSNAETSEIETNDETNAVKIQTIPFEKILENVKQYFNPESNNGGIGFSQITCFLEETRNSLNPRDAANKMNLNVDELVTVIKLIHPNLPTSSAKYRFTKIAKALKEGTVLNNSFADWPNTQSDREN